MNEWRPWVLAALCIAMFIGNGALCYFEDIRPAEQASGPVDRVSDRLVGIPYGPGTRRSNMSDYGLDGDLRERAAARADRIWTREHDRLQILLTQNASEVSGSLCPGTGLPERYAGLAILVIQRDAGGGVIERRVIDIETTTQLQVEDWYVTSLVPDVYERLELSKPSHDDSTVMGLAAVLANVEDSVIERERPFGGGLTGWSWSRVQSNNPEVTEKLIEYLAIMHVLTELARDPETGICR